MFGFQCTFLACSFRLAILAQVHAVTAALIPATSVQFSVNHGCKSFGRLSLSINEEKQRRFPSSEFCHACLFWKSGSLDEIWDPIGKVGAARVNDRLTPLMFEGFRFLKELGTATHQRDEWCEMGVTSPRRGSFFERACVVE